jgi:hypothetical protein
VESEVNEVEQKHEQSALSLAAQAPIDQLPAVTSDANNLMGAIIACASNQNVDADKVERLLGMYERIKAANAKAAYFAALSDMQDDLPAIQERGIIGLSSNDKKNPKYALWEDINKAIKPVMKAHGFALSFRTGTADGKITVTGILSHRDGHSEETTMSLPVDTGAGRNAVQAVGSSTSYGKRYTACALLNITSTGEDDDGEKAGNGPYIDETQADQLLDLAGTAFTDPAKKAHLIARLCEKFKIENITMLRLKDFRDACQLLNDTITTVKDKARAAAPKAGETK